MPTRLETSHTGGYRASGPILIRGEGSVGITWYRNSGAKKHINRVMRFIAEGRSSYQ